MPSPNKYASNGRRYTVNEDPRAVSSTRYIVRGYINPKRSFEWYGESRIKPFNKGINASARAARAQGLKFRKSDFYV